MYYAIEKSLNSTLLIKLNLLQINCMRYRWFTYVVGDKFYFLISETSEQVNYLE